MTNKKKARKPVQIFLQLSKIVFVLIVVVNLILTVNTKHVFGFSLFNFIALLIWTYGFISSLGFIKTVASEEEDGSIIYETRLPFLWVAVVRLAQLGYYQFLSKADMNFIYFIILVVLDSLYTILLLIDKSSYYYISLEEK